LEIAGYVAALAAGVGGLALYSNHPRFDDPMHKLAWALCSLCTLSNLLLTRIGRRGEVSGLTPVEGWLVRLGAVTVMVGLLWDVAVAFRPELPAPQGYAEGGGIALVALAIVLGVVRRSRMPKASQRPPALVLD
jgi:hypothetical protein